MTRFPKKICSRIGLALLAMMVLWLIGGTVTAPLLNYIMPNWQENGIGLWLLNDIPLYFIGVPAFLLIVAGIPNGAEPAREKKRFHVGHFILAVLFCLGAMYGAGFVANLFMMFWDAMRGGQTTNNLAALANDSPWWVSLLFGAVVPALGEEYVFRYVLRKKLRGSGDKIFIFFSALCFSLFHGNFSQITYAFGVGAVLAYLYTYTGNIWVPISLHFILNSMGMVIMPAVVEYGGELAIVLVGFFTLVLIAGAVVVLGCCYKRVSGGFLPPSEAGWPIKVAPQPQPWQQPANFAYPAVPFQPQPYPYGFPQPPQAYPVASMPHPGYVPAAPQPYPQGQPGYPAYPAPQQAVPPAYPAQHPAYHRPPPTRHSQGPYGAPSQPQVPTPPYPSYPTYQPYQPAGYPPYSPYYAPYQPQGYAQPWQSLAPQAPKEMGAKRLCLINLGMILYMSLAVALAVLSLFS